MARPIDDTEQSQRKKYEQHKKANGTLSYYLEQGNYIGAYVIAYSLLEDRIRAMYVVVQRDINKAELVIEDVKRSVGGIIGYLQKNGYLTKEVAKQLHKANHIRNTLLHDAMWAIDVFKEEDVLKVKDLKNEVAKALERLKKSIKAK
jgi:uncharacterized protein YutE (UPF0331/DUF86 family)